MGTRLHPRIASGLSQNRPTSATSDYRHRAGSDSPPCWEPPRSPRASSTGFKVEIRCNFRSLQQYSSLAVFCAGGSPSRRAARLNPMNAVGGIIHVRRRASGCPLRAPCLMLQSWGFRHRDSVAALGVGANTAIFSLINAVILRTLPVSHPEQLVELGMKTKDGHSFYESHLGAGARPPGCLLGSLRLQPHPPQSGGGRRSSQRQRQLGQWRLFPHARGEPASWANDYRGRR